MFYSSFFFTNSSRILPIRCHLIQSLHVHQLSNSQFSFSYLFLCIFFFSYAFKMKSFPNSLLIIISSYSMYLSFPLFSFHLSSFLGVPYHHASFPGSGFFWLSLPLVLGSVRWRHLIDEPRHYSIGRPRSLSSSLLP